MTSGHIDFIGIGTAKSASTWIFRCLSEHPEINPALEKEVRFFDNTFNFRKGLHWYFRFFHPSKPQQLTGEFTPSYIYSIETAKRIKSIFPKVKLIVTFRNPIDTVYSMYWYNKIGGRGSYAGFKTFEEAIRINPGILENALHGKQFQDYLSIFPREQFHVVFYDDIRSDPEMIMRGVYRFLDIDENFVAQGTHHTVNETGDKRIRYPFLFKMIYRIYWKLNRFASMRGVMKIFNTSSLSVRLGRAFTTRGNVPFKRPEMFPETREKLRAYFKDDIRLLGELTGRDLSVWN